MEVAAIPRDLERGSGPFRRISVADLLNSDETWSTRNDMQRRPELKPVSVPSPATHKASADCMEAAMPSTTQHTMIGRQINFPPFESLTQEAQAAMKRFDVPQFGEIQRSREHIPYTSEKKNLRQKIGRQSIEAFKYTFVEPERRKQFTIMWDYNNGLVRMSPIFKSLGYSKTKPAQVLDQNPGLRDVSPSITGGSVSAQGYWFPYGCARALCTTFCYRVSGALIPIFGPSFPKDCISPESPHYGKMVIPPRMISDAQDLLLIASENRSRQSDPARHPARRDFHHPDGPIAGRAEEIRSPSPVVEVAGVHDCAVDTRKRKRNGEERDSTTTAAESEEQDYIIIIIEQPQASSNVADVKGSVNGVRCRAPAKEMDVYVNEGQSSARFFASPRRDVISYERSKQHETLTHACLSEDATKLLMVPRHSSDGHASRERSSSCHPPKRQRVGA